MLPPVFLLLAAGLAQCLGQTFIYPYTYVCTEGRCVKQAASSVQPYVSLNVCMLQCSPYGAVWPRPYKITLARTIVPINSNSITITSSALGVKSNNDKTAHMIEQLSSRFTKLMSAQDRGKEPRQLRSSLEISLQLEQPEVVTVTQDTDESYNLSLSQTPDGRVIVVIAAPTYFGARHGLETLSQLVVYDYVSGGLVAPSSVTVQDRPVYPYRGVLLDTARNFVSIPVLHRLIDAMSANKLNTFHWHITDSHSFPFHSRTFPKLSQFGAYSPEKVYSEQDIAGLVEYARVRGVRIVPELDAPAHVGEGWQWADQQNVTVCFKKEPWQQFCVEPPCGQINPTSDYAYEILEGIYADMERLFESDLFHMGGDEVNINCWNSTEAIRAWMATKNLKTDEDGLHQLWNIFQTRALERLDSVSREPHKIVVWTSSLTEKGRVDKYLDKERYIIQIWTTGKDEIIAELVNKGFQVIFSNYDALYFDCGFGAWVGEGNNWCSPYIGWQKVYENKPISMLQALGVNTSNAEVKNLILGQEATLWTEQADDQVVDQRLWPRAAAMAERLWSDPAESWKAAEHRFLYHRERLVARGIPADSIEPKWCLQNQGYCYL